MSAPTGFGTSWLARATAAAAGGAGGRISSDEDGGVPSSPGSGCCCAGSRLCAVEGGGRTISWGSPTKVRATDCGSILRFFSATCCIPPPTARKLDGMLRAAAGRPTSGMGGTTVTNGETSRSPRIKAFACSVKACARSDVPLGHVKLPSSPESLSYGSCRNGSIRFNGVGSIGFKSSLWGNLQNITGQQRKSQTLKFVQSHGNT